MIFIYYKYYISISTLWYNFIAYIIREFEFIVNKFNERVIADYKIGIKKSCRKIKKCHSEAPPKNLKVLDFPLDYTLKV